MVEFGPMSALQNPPFRREASAWLPSRSMQWSAHPPAGPASFPARSFVNSNETWDHKYNLRIVRDNHLSSQECSTPYPAAHVKGDRALFVQTRAILQARLQLSHTYACFPGLLPWHASCW